MSKNYKWVTLYNNRVIVYNCCPVPYVTVIANTPPILFENLRTNVLAYGVHNFYSLRILHYIAFFGSHRHKTL